MSGEVVGMDYNQAEQEKKWQAESDARTLAEAEVIKNDAGRLKAAQEIAKSLADEKEKEAKGMKSVVGMKYKDASTK